MVLIRSNAVKKNAPPQDAANDEKYLKRKRKKRRKQQKNPQWVCIGISALVLLYMVRWARQHLDLRQQRARLQRLKRAYSLKRVREEEEQVHKDEPRPIHMLNNKNAIKKTKPSDDKEDPLEKALEELDKDMIENRHGGIRWIRPHLLPSIPGVTRNNVLDQNPGRKGRYPGAGGPRGEDKPKFKAKRRKTQFAWEKEIVLQDKPSPKVDYTKHEYQYPEFMSEPPSQGGYPPLETLGELYQRWPQDQLDSPPTPYVERLLHFDYTDPQQREAARKFRDAELPFKMTNVPELHNATLKWTDEYLSEQFDVSSLNVLSNNNPLGNLLRGAAGELPPPPRSSGACQESPNNFFAFFIPGAWDVQRMGLPPTRNNDFTFQRWAQHARYADAVGLDFDQPHFYYQSGVPKEERDLPPSKWTFVSRDLPSWSSPTPTFFVFDPTQQKGIQCRFGERGVTAATHYDAGRNMVAMITGAKRYVLSPPNQCSKLGIINTRGQPAFRHSLLNFAHLSHLNDTTTEAAMSKEERAWLERASTSKAIDTVLKAGEVLYIPSHWFHYITSLQKSAQCNVRSGRERQGTKEFGGFDDVDKCDA